MQDVYVYSDHYKGKDSGSLQLSLLFEYLLGSVNICSHPEI